MNRQGPSLRILLTGATGLVGRALVHRLARDGHRVTAWVRDVDSARATLGADVALLDHRDDSALVEAMAEVDAVVNLAGRPIARRFTRRAWREITESRVGVTERLVEAMRRADRRPSVLVSASAIGIYGDTGDRATDETSPTSEGLLGGLCERWEAAAFAASALGVRVAALRIGLVLDRTGGVLAALLPAFGAGLGAVIGPGDQWVSFIHSEDLVEMIATAIVDERWRGPIDAVAPQPVHQRVFARAVADAVGSKARVRVPGWALRVALGRAAGLLLDSQRVLPTRARELGFRFRHPEVAEAVADAVSDRGGTLQIRPVAADEALPEELRGQPRPSFVLEQHTRIQAPLEEVVPFFQRAENLGAITPPQLSFRIASEVPAQMSAGTEIRYRIRLGVVPMGWRTRIDAWDPPHRFVDTQLSGPYRTWVHEHEFRRRGDTTEMIDRVWYTPPLGPLGRLANRVFILPTLRRIFGFRRRIVELRFGLPSGEPPRELAA